MEGAGPHIARLLFSRHSHLHTPLHEQVAQPVADVTCPEASVSHCKVMTDCGLFSKFFGCRNLLMLLCHSPTISIQLNCLHYSLAVLKSFEARLTCSVCGRALSMESADVARKLAAAAAVRHRCQQRISDRRGLEDCAARLMGALCHFSFPLLAIVHLWLACSFSLALNHLLILIRCQPALLSISTSMVGGK